MSRVPDLFTAQPRKSFFISCRLRELCTLGRETYGVVFLEHSRIDPLSKSKKINIHALIANKLNIKCLKNIALNKHKHNQGTENFENFNMRSLSDIDE